MPRRSCGSRGVEPWCWGGEKRDGGFPTARRPQAGRSRSRAAAAPADPSSSLPLPLPLPFHHQVSKAHAPEMKKFLVGLLRMRSRATGRPIALPTRNLTPPPAFPIHKDKRLDLKLNGNRHVIGILRGFDPFMNIVLEDAEEEKSGGARTPIGMVVRGCMPVFVCPARFPLSLSLSHSLSRSPLLPPPSRALCVQDSSYLPLAALEELSAIATSTLLAIGRAHGLSPVRGTIGRCAFLTTNITPTPFQKEKFLTPTLFSFSLFYAPRRSSAAIVSR